MQQRSKHAQNTHSFPSSDSESELSEEDDDEDEEEEDDDEELELLLLFFRWGFTGSSLSGCPFSGVSGRLRRLGLYSEVLDTSWPLCFALCGSLGSTSLTVGDLEHDWPTPASLVRDLGSNWLGGKAGSWRTVDLDEEAGERDPLFTISRSPPFCRSSLSGMFSFSGSTSLPLLVTSRLGSSIPSSAESEEVEEDELEDELEEEEGERGGASLGGVLTLFSLSFSLALFISFSRSRSLFLSRSRSRSLDKERLLLLFLMGEGERLGLRKEARKGC